MMTSKKHIDQRAFEIVQELIAEKLSYVKFTYENGWTATFRREKK